MPTPSAIRPTVVADAPPRDDAARRPWSTALLLLALWTVPGVFSAAQSYVSMRLEGEPVTWGRALLTQLPGWYFWALATPVIAWLGARAPLERGAWRRGVPVHVVAAIAAAVAHVAFVVTLRKSTAEIPLTWGALAGRYLMAYLVFDVITYWAVLGVVLAVRYYREAQERARGAARLEAQLAQARLQALRMQLHPHFLFNALNSVAMLVREGDARQAVRMIAGLSDLLRQTLDGDGTHEVPLRDEIALLERYLAIERVRFADRLRVRIDVAAEVAEVRVPNLVLQPLVENAIRHGIARRAAAGAIDVVARREDGRLVLEVRDDGPGLGPGFSAGPNGTGVGLANTRARLAQLYGAAGQLSIAARPDGGVVARVVVPLRGAPPNDTMPPDASPTGTLPTLDGPDSRTAAGAPMRPPA
ncbi:MAG TPA: histidine kinase [Gemmatimonadaceae bacterium]|nr:histidine kinase [Gemmatimonadaceae bacterium]